MTILLVFTYGYSLDLWKKSGVLDREIGYYKLLSQKYNLRFIFLTYGDTNDYKIIEDYEFIEVISVYRFFKKKKNKFINILNLLFHSKNIFKHLPRFDLIKQNQLEGIFLSAMLKRLSKKQLFIKTGYDMYLFSKYQKKSFFKKFYYLLQTLIGFKTADFYSFSSKYEIEKMKNVLFYSKNKIVYIPNFIDFKNIKSNNIKLPIKKLIMIGRLEDQKNYEFVIKQLINTDYELNVYGTGSKESELKSLSRKLNVKVNFFSNINNKDLLKILSKYKIYINASKYEGNPKTLLEAMASKCLPIVSNIPNNNEVVIHDYNGLIFNSDNDLIQLLNNLNNFDIELLTNNAYETIQENNSVEKIAEIEYRIYLNSFNSTTL